MRNRLLNLFDTISNVKWNLFFLIYWFLKKEFRNTLSLNKQFKNIHSNKRCFIVGNGPSLKKMDLSFIKDEICFSVNTIMNNKEIYETINPNYHLIIDPAYYKLSENSIENEELVKSLLEINYKNIQPVVFTNYEGKAFFEKFDVDKKLNLYYIFQHKNFTDNKRIKIDLTKNLPTAQNVVQGAIYAAIYMGFREVYLLGCDMTSIFLTFESDDDGEKEIGKNLHAYNYTENEKKIIKRDSLIHDNEYMLYDYAKTFTIFKNIRKFAEQRNIQIYNVTKGGGLDVFQRIKYESLFKI